MTDLALDLAKRIVAGGNITENVQRWAEDSVAESSDSKGKKGGK